jgi:hypothetical protein
MGCILHELAFGRRAFESDWKAMQYAKSWERDLQYPINTLPDAWDEISREVLEKSLKNMLDRLPYMRYTASQLSDTFEMMSKRNTAPNDESLSPKPSIGQHSFSKQNHCSQMATSNTET